MYLKDRVDFLYGFSVRIGNEKNGDYPVYGSNGITGYIDNYKIEAPGIIIGRKGSVGSIKYSDKNFTPTDTAYYISIKNKQEDDIKFWYYYLQLLGLNKLNTHSSVPGLSREIAYSIKINPPSLKTQQRIAAVLSALDAKIELNNRINKELEAMAKTIYDYWFVQFDFPCLPENYKFSGAGKPDNFEAVLTYRQVGGLPFFDGVSWFVYVILCDDGSFYKGITNDLYRRYYEHATGQGADWTKSHKPVKIIHYEKFHTKEEAAKREKELKTGFGRTWLTREYKKPAHQTRLMMAGKMVWNDQLKREIPVGWEVGKLSEIANITMGQSPPGHSYNEDENGHIFYQGCTDFGNRFPTIRQFTTSATRFAKKGDILLSVRAPVGTINIANTNCCIGRGLAALNSKDNCISYLYEVVKNLKQIFDRRNVDGTTFGSITKDDLFSIQVVKPDNQILELYQKIMEPCFEKQNQIEEENQTLASLRDFLLPMLMNGQVRVE